MLFLRNSSIKNQISSIFSNISFNLINKNKKNFSFKRLDAHCCILFLRKATEITAITPIIAAIPT